MTDRLTLTQRALRPIINWAVERFFPDGVFYGLGMLKMLEDFDKDRTCVPVAGYLINRAVKAGGTVMTVQMSGLTIRGEEHGDWLLTIERTRAPDQGQQVTR